jgi:thiamine biosynthesis lipoprotein
MTMSFARASLFLVGASMLTLARPVESQARQEFSAVHMGVPVRMVLHASSEPLARDAARAAFARIAELDDKMSDYRPRSEVRMLSQHPGDWQPVSRDLLAVLARAEEVSRNSGGAFDVTIGPLVQLWREARRAGRLPDPDALSRARSRSGAPLLELDTARRMVRLWVHGMQLDLGGIAKGYILQEALAVLRVRGVRSAMLEAGGDVVVGDPPPGQQGWSVFVAGADTATLRRARALSNAAVATSGGSEQYVEIGGVRYSHIIDPRTGLGVTGRHLVTVIADDAALADAAATALSVLGPDRSSYFRSRYSTALVSFRLPAVAR